MALRVTNPSVPATTSPTALSPTSERPEDVSARTSAESLAVQNLVDHAPARLLPGAEAGFLELFEAAAQLPPQRRYQAAKRLIERGLSLAASRAGGELIELLVVLAQAVTTQLEAEPAEPVLLNYAGVIFYELWSLEAARALFVAARRLDPELPHLDANLAGVRARQRAQSRQRHHRHRAQLHPAMAQLTRRALALAPRARPAGDLRLSLCMIVKNEEEMLGRCLAAAAPGVDEIVIVDTGSTDATIEIAHAYGALVIEQAWTGSFAEARNASFAAASGDWILYLDADEVLVADDVAELRRLRGQTWREAFFLHETNFTGNAEAGVAVVHSALRMFRNRPEYRFSGRLHEQIAQTLPTYLPERIRQSPVRVDHYGYLGSVRAAKEKSARNVELLLAARADGDPVGPFEHFNLGSEYMALERFNAAATEFEAAWRLATAPGGAGGHYVPSLAGRLVSALRQAGQPELALTRAEEALARFPDFTDLVYQQGLACLNLGAHADAIAHLERCIAMGDAPSRYTAIVGCGTFLPRIALAELRLRLGETGAALELLRFCAAHHPGFFGTYHPYALALLAAGHSGAEALAEIDAGLGDRATSMIRFILATALLEGGAVPEATGQLEAVLARRPDNVPALELLLECRLLAQDFGGFETDLARFAQSALPERERRERLAQLYLRHGFLRSAGREWMAVLEREPDPAALRGLAEVARRNGQSETAVVFSQEALRLASASPDRVA